MAMGKLPALSPLVLVGSIRIRCRILDINTVNRTQVMAVILQPIFGVLFFTGVYLPQKLVLSSPVERQYVTVQRYVPSYYIQIRKG
jgi:hypothetical protein